MSELTICNYCNLRSIRARAKKEKKKVEVRKVDREDYQLGGWDIFVDGKFEAWMMEIPNHCYC